MTGRSEPSPASGTANRMGAETEQIRWYVMTGYALDKRRGMSIAAQVEKYNAEHGSDFEVFAPTFVKVYNEAKSPRRRMLPLACQYFFIRGRLSQVKDLHLSDEDMSAFRSMALAYKYNMPCFSPSEVDLVACDKVRIVGGEFAGVEGYLVSQQGRDGGRVIIKVGELMAVQTLDINPKYISVLSFAKGSRRMYDKIDSYEPKLRRAMDYYKRNGDLDVTNAAAVSYFITRFGLAEIPTAKMRAKVSALLAASYYLMGDKERYEAAKCSWEAMAGGCACVAVENYFVKLADQ